jgi:competence protein ComEA
MPTPSEKKALAFLSAFLLLGAGVRMTQAVGRASTADAQSREALRQQIASAESAGAAERTGKHQPRARRGKAKPPAPDSVRMPTVISSPSIFDPPPVAPAGKGRTRKSDPPLTPIDVDRASAAELEALPRVGPALARRIVEDREADGPFGSLEGLQRVRGIGPAMAKGLAGHVTFSGTPRPSIAGRGGRDRSTASAPAGKRRPVPP